MAHDTRDLRGQVVLITGPARGIGAATARRLAARGARLALVGLEAERLRSLAQELGPETLWVEADVTDAAALDAAVEATVERFGGLDVAIANAGIPPPVTTVDRIDPAAFARVIDVNLLGVFSTVRAALPALTARDGYMLLIASLSAAAHGPLTGPYSAAKAGVEALGNVLRLETARQGVDVGVAYFGFIDTDMVRDSYAQPGAREMREGAARFLVRPLPVERAAKGIVRGIERRSQRIVVPRRVWPLVLAPGLLRPLVDGATRGAGLERALDAARRERG